MAGIFPQCTDQKGALIPSQDIRLLPWAASVYDMGGRSKVHPKHRRLRRDAQKAVFDLLEVGADIRCHPSVHGGSRE
jgi:hypothetical protein